ncbi:MAG: hypothetical protein QMD80_07075 [archaeon]|nr:hypothetical protein [archaeon]
MEATSKYLDAPIIMMYIGLGVTIVTAVLYVLIRVGHATPLTIEDVFAGFMVGQIFFNFGIVLEVSKLRK